MRHQPPRRLRLAAGRLDGPACATGPAGGRASARSGPSAWPMHTAPPSSRQRGEVVAERAAASTCNHGSPIWNKRDAQEDAEIGPTSSYQAYRSASTPRSRSPGTPRSSHRRASGRGCGPANAWRGANERPLVGEVGVDRVPSMLRARNRRDRRAGPTTYAARPLPRRSAAESRPDGARAPSASYLRFITHQSPPDLDTRADSF